MANYCENIFSLKGNSPEQIKRFMEFIKSEKSEFDFEKIIPYPNSKNECDEKYWCTKDSNIELLPGKEWFNWYDWCCDNWGCKWNGDVFFSDYGRIDFYTPWSMPTKIFERLAQVFQKTNFTVESRIEGFETVFLGKNKNGVFTIEQINEENQ